METPKLSEVKLPPPVTPPVPKLPAKVIAKRIESEQVKPAKPVGWWNLTDLSGSLEGVCRAIDANAEAPEHWKTAIKADLALRVAAGFNCVYLDAHFFVQNGKAVLHYDAEPVKMLV
jgi:hypothetical protein